MQTLEPEKFAALREGAEVLEADHYGDKVLRLRDETFLKLFRRKRLLSSAAWYPYAQRFADNARALTALGISCPEVIGVYRLPAISRDAVHYRPLEGRTIRQITQGSLTMDAGEVLRDQLGAFVARLHCQGVYFRSLHLGNVVLSAAETLGLIDIADMQLKNRPLRSHEIARNLRHILRYPADRAWLFAHDGDAFWSAYARETDGRIDVGRLRTTLAAEAGTSVGE